MTSVEKHYAELLAPIYVWMAGGLEAALAAGAGDVASYVPGAGLAIDLGAGFGMHALPLARGGYDVVAIDTSPELLDVLERNAAGLAVRAIRADLLDFRRYVDGPANLIVCLGDTLTHLEAPGHVERLFADCAASLAPGGKLVLTFRDYTRPAVGDARFIPVRSDERRIHTCFLETRGERMRVHDIVHERGDDGAWRMRVSSYDKLRLDPAWVVGELERVGLAVEVSPGPRGMVRVEARPKG